jgi:hypothetical protein
MKIILLFLVLLNVLFYGWSNWVVKQPQELAVVTPEPEAEPLVLFEEAFPERAKAQREALEKIARDERLAQQAAAREAARVEQQARLDAALEAAQDTESAATVEGGQAGTGPVAVPAGGEDAADADTDSSALSPDAVATPQVDIVETPASLAAASTGADLSARQLPSPVQSDGSTLEVPSALLAATPPAEPSPTPAQAIDALDELAAAAGAASQSAALAMTRDGPSNARCVALGPFINLRDAAQATAALRESGLDTAQRLEESLIWVGHWVYLAPAATRAEAIGVVETLREDGVSDIYIETSGEMRHAISLGLFSDAAGAETRAGKIRKLGVRPQIRDRFRDGTVYWIDFELAPGQDVDPERFEGGSAGRKIRLEERDCGEGAATG